MLNIRKLFHRRNPLEILANEFSNFQTNKISKVLIANRGEIACRITKTAKKLGIQTVAVYSDADRNSLHADLADEAYHIGPSSSNDSYLRQDRIIDVARRCQCQAIHPGYGFLSENMEFAELCQQQNIIFIGPPASAIRDMGIKSTSKIIMQNAGVPVIEGYQLDDQRDETLLAEAKKLGFPVMIKAVRGGGGKGMRIVTEDAGFLEALASARTESQKAFGDSDVLIEKYIINPRHVEVQIFADLYGNTVYLFERDCSVQRRHQKVIEEAPAPGLSDKIRREIGEAAVKAAKAVGYVGAGTVEFIFDQKDQKFYFMEMNTRLQVEHPITEAITGLDLVEWQLKIAAGERLPLDQGDIKMNGHAFEARIYAEDPRGGFLPRAGPLLYLRTPQATENIRIETGVREGDEVSVHYDPMIAKLVVWGKNRSEALAILKSKLSDYNIAGVETNVEFLKDLCRHPGFERGEVHTGFINESMDTLFPKLKAPDELICQATLAMILSRDSQSSMEDLSNPFETHLGFRLNHTLDKTFKLQFDGNEFNVNVKYLQSNCYLMRINNGLWFKINGKLIQNGDVAELKSEFEGKKSTSRIAKLKDEINIFTNDRSWRFSIPSEDFSFKPDGNVSASGAAVSPMPGIVDKILVSASDLVKKDDPLVVIVAMKMEYVIKAVANGKVEEILCQVGETVAKNRLLIKISEDQN